MEQRKEWESNERAYSGARHVDHEMSQLLLLHEEFRSARFDLYPDVVRRAMRVAYAAHFRVLMEFFHGRRPPTNGGRDLRSTDIRYTDYSAPEEDASADPFGEYTEAERQRVFDADKLLAHLSVERNDRGDRPDWGGDGDFLLVGCKILRLFEELDQGRELFPRSFGILHGILPFPDCPGDV